MGVTFTLPTETISMMNKLSALSLFVLAACCPPATTGAAMPQNPTTPEPVAVESPVAPTAPSGPRPQIGSWGFDSAGMDPTVSPGTSFHRYASGTWLKNTKIPDDKSNYGMFTVLSDVSEQRTRAIIEAAAASGGAPGSEEQQVGDFYKSFMDEAAVEAAGVAPIQADLDAIAAIKNADGVVARFAASARHFDNSPFFTYVSQDGAVRTGARWIQALHRGDVRSDRVQRRRQACSCGLRSRGEDGSGALDRSAESRSAEDL
jgi:Peptidase family M13